MTSHCESMGQIAKRASRDEPPLPYSFAKRRKPGEPIKVVLLSMAMSQEAEKFCNAHRIMPVNINDVVTNKDAAVALELSGGVLLKGEYKSVTLYVVLPGKHGQGEKVVDRVGTMPAALCTFLGIRALEPDLVLNAGTAGGFASHGGKIGKKYIANAFQNHDRLINIPGYKEYGIDRRGEHVLTPEVLLREGFEFGTVSTGDSLDCFAPDVSHVSKDQVVAKDMEAAGVAWASSLFSPPVPVLALKVIVDIVDHQVAAAEFSANIREASKKLHEAISCVLDTVIHSKVVLVSMATSQEAERFCTANKLAPCNICDVAVNKEAAKSLAIFDASILQGSYATGSKSLRVFVLLPGKQKQGDDMVDRVSMVPAALCTFLGIRALQPDVVINAGTAGGFASQDGKLGKSEIGKVYIASQIQNHDRRIHIPGTGYEEYGVDKRTENVFSPEALRKKGFEFGVVSTGNSLDTIEESNSKIAFEGGVVAKEMEGAAIAWAASLFNPAVPVLGLKVITDIVDGPHPTADEFSANLEEASRQLQQAIPQVLDVLVGKCLSEI